MAAAGAGSGRISRCGRHRDRYRYAAIHPSGPDGAAGRRVAIHPLDNASVGARPACLDSTQSCWGHRRRHGRRGGLRGAGPKLRHGRHDRQHRDPFHRSLPDPSRRWPRRRGARRIAESPATGSAWSLLRAIPAPGDRSRGSWPRPTRIRSIPARVGLPRLGLAGALARHADQRPAARRFDRHPRGDAAVPDRPRFGRSRPDRPLSCSRPWQRGCSETPVGSDSRGPDGYSVSGTTATRSTTGARSSSSRSSRRSVASCGTN